VFFGAETKNQWARDDPAFAVVQVVFLVVAACAYGAVFQVTGLLNYLWLIANVVLVHWLGCGIIVSSLCWYESQQVFFHCSDVILTDFYRWASNKYLRVHHEHR
jgi:hypothetical protein